MRLTDRGMILVLGLLASCGGGDGGGGSAAAPPQPPSPPPPAGSVLGSRALPGHAAEVRLLGPATPGGTVAVEVRVTPEPGGSIPVQVEAAVSADEPSAWQAGSPVAGRTGVWTWTMTMPATLTGQRVRVRLTDAEGNIAESGFADFTLAE